jgi:hypothetical protein
MSKAQELKELVQNYAQAVVQSATSSVNSLSRSDPVLKRFMALHAAIDAQQNIIDEQWAELEHERMRLAACGVVALSNTPESAARAREMLPEYRSASCDDVARAVDREMQYCTELAEARAEIERLTNSLSTTCERMDRARGILTNDNPRPECNWGMLDSSDLQAIAAVSQTELKGGV